ncbi:polysaccharide biosynthesis protein [Croceivirga lutea]|uniref:oligosaccharide flippase family protein n=1 Tax=Croceivirga lutea TaxID=1775167 RepID=UPI00163B2B91|nr:oligosaccharide flippase family protein [Croceivirga lutea]GGG55019.1 polysaccharide biosynthesis protein [Croceivirga lutea]
MNIKKYFSLNKQLRKQLLTQGSYAILASVVRRTAFIVISIYLARLLEKVAFGELMIIRSTIDSFLLFSGLGLGLTVTKLVPEQYKSDKKRAFNILNTCFLILLLSTGLISLAVYLFSEVISLKLLNSSELSKPLKIAILILMGGSISTFMRYVLSAFFMFKSFFIASLISTLISLPLFFYLASILNLDGALYGYAIIEIVFSIIMIFILSKFFLKEGNYNFNLNINQEIGTIVNFALPAFLAGLLVTPVLWYGKTILINSSSGALHLADFEVSFQIMAIILFVPNSFSQIILPHLSSNLSKKNVYRSILNTNILLNVFLSFLLSIPIFFFPKLILNLYGENYQDTDTLRILVICATLMIVNNIIGKVIASKNKMWIGFMLNAIWATLFLLLSYYFVSRDFGALGLALSFTLAHFFHLLNQLILLFWLRKK